MASEAARDANTVRLALINYRALLRDVGRPDNALQQQALAIAERLLAAAEAEDEGRVSND